MVSKACYLGLFRITRAAITPGTHPHKVKSKTIKTEPQPRSSTERGGNRMASNTRRKLMMGTFFDEFHLYVGHRPKLLQPGLPIVWRVRPEALYLQR